MKCAYDDGCEDVAQPFWIRSVGIPLCERHMVPVWSARTFKQLSDSRSLELLLAAAVAELDTELAVRELTAA